VVNVPSDPVFEVEMEKMSNISTRHCCPNCGSEMEKEQGSKGTYRCPKCRKTVNFHNKAILGDVISWR
jgi:tRNA(Ile2) C34 agmatinyltransferase TiaS